MGYLVTYALLGVLLIVLIAALASRGSTKTD